MEGRIEIFLQRSARPVDWELTMTRRAVTRLFVPLLTACGYSPSQPIIVSESDGEESGTGGATTQGMTGDPSGDPTTASTTGATASTTPSTTEDSADSGTSESTTTESASSSTGPVGPFCGDGTPDEGEACDDGNDVNGDGCNTDCVESGTVLWTVDYAEDYELPEEGLGDEAIEHVAISPDGSIYVVGRAVVYEQTGVLVRALDDDGDVVWTDVLYAALGDDPHYALDLAAGDDVIVVCGFVGASVIGDGFVQAYDPEGARVWDHAWTAGIAAARGCLVLDDGDVIVVGNESFDAQIRRYDGANGDVIWTDGSNLGVGRGVSLRSDGLLAFVAEGWLGRFTDNGVLASDLAIDVSGFAVAGGPLASEYVAAAGSGESIYRRYDDDVVTWSHVATADAYSAIATDGVGNAIVVGEHDDDIWVRKLSSDGEELWTATHAGNGGGLDAASSVAVDADDNIFVAGTELTNGGRRAWLRKYAP